MRNAFRAVILRLRGVMLKYAFVGHTILVRLLTFPITITAALVTTSLTIGYAGPTGFAAVAVISTISQLFPYSDLGIGAGVINGVASTERSSRKQRAVIASGLRVLSGVGLAVLLIAPLGATFFSWQSVLSVSDSGLDSIDLAVALSIGLFGCSIPLGLGQRILLGVGKAPLATAIGVVVPVATLLITLAIVQLALDPAILSIAAPLASFAAALLGFGIAIRATRFKLRDTVDRSLKHRGLIGHGLWYLVVLATGAATLQYGRVTLAARSSLEEVAQFSLVMQLYSPLWSVVLLAGTALWPHFTKQRASRTTTPYAQITLVFLFLGLSIALALVMFGSAISVWISGGEVVASVALLAACGFMISVQSVHLVLGVAQTSMPDFRFQAFFGVPLALLSIGGAWMLAPQIGSTAPFLATAVSLLVFGVVPNALRLRWRLSTTPQNGTED